MGVALGVQKSAAKTIQELKEEFAVICETLAKTRPTAVDLFLGAGSRSKARFCGTDAIAFYGRLRESGRR